MNIVVLKCFAVAVGGMVAYNILVHYRSSRWLIPTISDKLGELPLLWVEWDEEYTARSHKKSEPKYYDVTGEQELEVPPELHQAIDTAVQRYLDTIPKHG